MLTPEQIKTILNHMPTVKGNVEVFLTAFNAKLDEEEKIDFLLALIDKMEVDLQECKNVLEAAYPP